MDLSELFSDPLFIVIAVIILLAFVVWLAVTINDFTNELRYVNNEIARTDGAEREMWKRRKRRLWLSLIPFVRY